MTVPGGRWDRGALPNTRKIIYSPTMKRRRGRLSLVVVGLWVLVALMGSLASVTAQKLTGRVLQNAPLFLLPTSRDPLLVMEAGVEVQIIRAEGSWLNVTVEGSRFGPRTGYVEAKYVSEVEVLKAPPKEPVAPSGPVLPVTPVAPGRATAGPRSITLTVYSDPSGSSVYESGRPLGRTPFTRKYNADDNVRKRNGCMSIQPLSAIWASGVEASIADLSLCGSAGGEATDSLRASHKRPRPRNRCAGCATTRTGDGRATRRRLAGLLGTPRATGGAATGARRSTAAISSHSAAEATSAADELHVEPDREHDLHQLLLATDRRDAVTYHRGVFSCRLLLPPSGIDAPPFHAERQIA